MIDWRASAGFVDCREEELRQRVRFSEIFRQRRENPDGGGVVASDEGLNAVGS